MNPTSLAIEDDIRVIAWAQTQANFGPAEVYQAAQIEWFMMVGGVFKDGFESSDLGGWSLAVE